MSTSQRFASIAAAACLIFAPLVYSVEDNSSVWTGAGTNGNWSNASNWQGGSVPASGADVTLNAQASQKAILLDTSPLVNSLTISGNGYNLDNGTLTIGSGGMTVGDFATYSYSSAFFYSSASISLAGSQTWTIGGLLNSNYTYLYIYGNINGSSTDLLDVSVYGGLILAGNNDFSGTVTIQSGGQLYVGSDTALGNATLHVNGSATIMNNSGDRTLANAVTFNGGKVLLYPSYNSLTFSGSITVSNPTDISVWGSAPVIFSGGLGESGGAQSISKSGTGMLVLSSSLNNTGGASVNDGLVIVGSSTAIPAAGTVGVYGDGYLGLDAATGIPAAGFISRLDPASSGTIGFDTATLASPAIISDAINLSGFTGNPRLGSATSAKLTGLITPAAGTYNFGGGGGTLEVASNLTGENSLNLYSPYGQNQSLTLILSGANSYSGNTTIDNSLLRFANSPALSGITGIFSFSNRGYLGLDFTPTAAELDALAPRIDVSSGTAVFGLDSPNPAAPNTLTISTDTLNLFPYGAYIGTSTNATIGISKGDSSMPSLLSLAAVRNGHLTVSSLPEGEYSVTIGLPNDYFQTAASDYTYDSRARGIFASAASTVTLLSANNYSGGTTLQGGRLELGDSGALGTGALTVIGSSVLATTVDALTIANDVSSGYASLTLDATNSFTLSGAISGYGSITKIGSGTVQLSGVSPTFTGYFDVSQGTLNVANDSALSAASLNVNDTANFLTAAPSIGALSGSGVVNLNSAVLSINGSGSGEFYGVIGGAGSLVLNNSGNLYLYGNNTYSGGTTVNGSADFKSVLISGSDTALGSGPVSVLGGSLYLMNNATLSNPFTFGSGTIGGVGTFATTGGVVIGNSQVIAPGVSNSSVALNYGLGNSVIGTLSFASAGLTLASGGTYLWEVADASGVAGTGWDEILVAGTLTITSTPGAPFMLTISPLSGETPYSGPRVFDNTQHYSWVIASASGGITGFDPDGIAIDSSGFDSVIGAGQFFLTQTGNDLMLNFTPVPEPSTYALIGLGLGVVAMGLRRRKRQARPRSFSH